MAWLYLSSFVLSIILSLVATLIVRRFALRQNIVDLPDGERRFHPKPTPTLGGLGIFTGFFLVSFGIGILGKHLLHGNIPLGLLIGIWISGLVLMIGGYLDDKYHLSPIYSVLFPVVATLVVIISGTRAVSVHNPITGNIVFLGAAISGLVVFVWTMTLTYTTKLLDGMDGLVTGISAIGALTLFGLSLAPQVRQPQTALLAIIFAGSLFGFLILNFHPAKIFLGESGSTFAGFMLAVLAVISGGKIATALLVMGIPLIDMLWVVGERLVSRQSPFSGDRKHLHFRLMQIGFSQRQTALLLYGLTVILGLSALFLQSRGKLVALVLLFIVMLAILTSAYSVFKNKSSAK